MESVEPKEHSQWWDCHVSPENSKWLAENLEGIDQSVKEMLKLIEEDENSSAKTPHLDDQKRPELITHIVEFSRMHRMMAERYDLLIGEVRRNCVPQMEHPDISELGSPQPSLYLTPDPKRSVDKSKQAGGFDFYLSSGGGYDISPREETEYSLSLSSDSDSDSFNSVNKLLISPVNNGDIAKGRESGGNEVFLKRITDYEEELILANKKLHTLEEENASLKCELKKNEAVIVLASNLQVQLESAQHDIKIQNANLETEKEKVLELQKQVTELKTLIGVSDSKIRTMGQELEMTREKLTCSEEESAKLKHELLNEISQRIHQLQGQLDSEKNNVLEMQEKILRYVAEILERDHQIRELNNALNDAKEKFSVEKIELESEISGLLEHQSLLDARVSESKHLENELKQCKTDIEMLKVELRQKSESVEDLNKTLDMLKLKYDMLMTEKDEANAQLDILRAQISSRDNSMQQMEDHLSNLQYEHMGTIDSAQRLTHELRQRVEELEREVETQREVISDRAEEKREAIRQLCVSLEHYRTGYKELRQAFIGHKQHAVLAS